MSAFTDSALCIGLTLIAVGFVLSILVGAFIHEGMGEDDDNGDN